MISWWHSNLFSNTHTHTHFLLKHCLVNFAHTIKNTVKMVDTNIWSYDKHKTKNHHKLKYIINLHSQIIVFSYFYIGISRYILVIYTFIITIIYVTNKNWITYLPKCKTSNIYYKLKWFNKIVYYNVGIYCFKFIYIQLLYMYLNGKWWHCI